MSTAVARSGFPIEADRPTWFLVYAVVDFPIAALVEHLHRRYPGVPVFGTTSFRGVFGQAGFVRGAALLWAEQRDAIHVAVRTAHAPAARARARATAATIEIVAELGGSPDVVLMHATPGHEERILEGIDDALGSDVLVYGGSAADDAIAGGWSVFGGGTLVGEGCVLAGFRSSHGVAGGFLSGYLPTHHVGTITRAAGRRVHEIDGRPAAVVYDTWADGAIRGALDKGGGVLLDTNLRPLGCVADESLGMPMRLLAHPHAVVAGTNALDLFAELKEGDTVTLMTGTPDPLIRRMEKVVERALGARGAGTLRGGVFVYCGGCLAVVLERAAEIAQGFRRVAGDIPFIGVATFGEQGTLVGRRRTHRHGNLMCNVILFR